MVEDRREERIFCSEGSCLNEAMTILKIHYSSRYGGYNRYSGYCEFHIHLGRHKFGRNISSGHLTNEYSLEEYKAILVLEE